MLTRDILDLWSDALRSGKYKQSKSEQLLDDAGRWCCLGVLGHVCGLSREKLREKSFLEDYDSGGSRRSLVLPSEVQEMFAGFNDGEAVEISDENGQDFSTFYTEPMSFEEIADLIDSMDLEEFE